MKLEDYLKKKDDATIAAIEPLKVETTNHNLFFTPGVSAREVDVDIWRNEEQIMTNFAKSHHSEILEDFINLGSPEELDKVEAEMLQQIDIPDYLKYDPEIVGYPGLDMQEKIYNWAIQDVDLVGKKVVDIGAGRGDLFDLLKFEQINSYTGIESKESLCVTGISKQTDARFSLVNQDYFKLDLKADVAFVIGTLNSVPTTNKWETFSSFFNKMYNEISNSIIFIINSNSPDDFNYFPFTELFTNILSGGNIPFKIDYSKFEGVYKLTVYKF